MEPEGMPLEPPGEHISTRLRQWTRRRRALAVLVGLIVAAAGGFWAGAYWASHPSPVTSPNPRAEILLMENVTVPAATFSSAGVVIQWNYWGNASYAGSPLALAYNASLPVDACLVDNHLVNSYASCVASTNASVLTNRSSGMMGFTVAKSSVGFTFGLFSPEGFAAEAAYAYWINDTNGTTLAESTWTPLNIPAPQLLSESNLPAWALLPADYDNVFVHGESSENLSVQVSLTASTLAATLQGRTWNWTTAYEISSTAPNNDLYLVMHSGSMNPVTASLLIVAFKS